jgi:hypothetical protein
MKTKADLAIHSFAIFFKLSGARRTLRYELLDIARPHGDNRKNNGSDASTNLAQILQVFR